MGNGRTQCRRRSDYNAFPERIASADTAFFYPHPDNARRDYGTSFVTHAQPGQFANAYPAAHPRFRHSLPVYHATRYGRTRR